MRYMAAVITHFFTGGADWIYQSGRQLSITLTILMGRPASILTHLLMVDGSWTEKESVSKAAADASFPF